MKRFEIIFLIFFSIVFFTFCITSRNEAPETDFEWNLYSNIGNNTGISIEKYVGESLDVIIPERIQGYPVLQIEDNAFGEKNLKSVRLPKTLTHIGKYAFYKNELERIVIPKGVIAIGEAAFSNNNLMSVTIPGTLTDIDEYVFSDNQIESVIIPEGIKNIESGAFSNNRIRSVSLPRSLTRIDWFAFNNNKLRELTLPENLEYVGTSVFARNEISRVTVYSKKVVFFASSLMSNPIAEIDVKSEVFSFAPQRAFHPKLPGYLPPGKYILGDNETWFVQNADGTLLSIQSYYEKLAGEDADALEKMTYEAIKNHDTELLRSCLSWGLNVNSKIIDRRSLNGNTPLAQALYYDSRGSPPWAKKFTPFNAEIVQILLEAGAVPQYWMLSVSYFFPEITKMLLEYGAFTNPESSEYGDPPGYYKRPESLVLHYCLKMGERPNTDDESFIAESTTVLVEYGLDANYRDPQTGQTPLTVALNSSPYSPEQVESLLRHVSRPLPLEDYRNLIKFNTRAVRSSVQYNAWQQYVSWQWYMERDRIDYIDYDEFVLEDVRQGILNPNSKDENGKDIFDYAATTGTAGLMRGLVPYLIASRRALFTADGTGLYIDALNAGNRSVAAVLFSAMGNTVATMKDDRRNEYSLESYDYDYETIYASAQRIPEYSLYQTGPGGTRPVGTSSGGANPDSRSEFTVDYRANEFYTIKHDHSDLLLRTTNGAFLNLSEIINKKSEQKPDNVSPEWYVGGIFGNILFVSNHSGYFLVDISSTVPSVYILDREVFAARSGAMDFVFSQNRDKAYSIKRSGEVLVFNVEADTIQFEETVLWRDCRISGWKDGERIFADGETVEAYNFATGTVRSLGTHIETPRGRIWNSNYLYEDEQSRRFIVEAKTGRVYPEPAEEYHGLRFFESGYAYRDKDYRSITLCYVEETLKRKLVLSGSVLWYSLSWNIDRGKMYFNSSSLAFTVDLRTGQVNRAFNTEIPHSNNSINVYMFPFGADDIVYTETLNGGK